MSDRILTVREAIAISDIMAMAQTNAKVARLVDDGDTVLYGTARSLCDANGGFIGSNTDIRDGYLRVTGRTGAEYLWPISQLIPEVIGHDFADYQWTSSSPDYVNTHRDPIAGPDGLGA